MPQSDPPTRRSLLPQISYAKNRAAWAGVSLTALAMLIGAILYVTNAIADTKVWAADQDHSTKIMLRSERKEDFVNKVEYTKDITVLNERQQKIKEDVSDIKDMLKEVHDEMRIDRNSRNNRGYTRNNDE